MSEYERRAPFPHCGAAHGRCLRGPPPPPRGQSWCPTPTAGRNSRVQPDLRPAENNLVGGLVSVLDHNHQPGWSTNHLHVVFFASVSGEWPRRAPRTGPSTPAAPFTSGSCICSPHNRGIACSYGFLLENSRYYWVAGLSQLPPGSAAAVYLRHPYTRDHLCSAASPLRCSAASLPRCSAPEAAHRCSRRCTALAAAGRSLALARPQPDPSGRWAHRSRPASRRSTSRASWTALS